MNLHLVDDLMHRISPNLKEEIYLGKSLGILSGPTFKFHKLSDFILKKNNSV